MSATLAPPPRVVTQAATLSVEGLSVTYPVVGGALAAVRDVSFAIAPGEAFGLIGESGSGKSTIAYSVMRYLRGATAAGRVVLEGQDIMALPDAALAAIRGRLAAMVYQDPMSALNPALRIGEQIAEVVRLHRGASRAEAAARAVALLAQVQLPDPAGMARRYPHQLSGGQQQRVVIAMALACDPKLLIMDEPTTGLDVTTEAVILDLINDLRRAAGVAVLFISHNIGVVAKVCDRVGVLYAGQMVEQGTMAEVLGRPRHPYTIGLMRALPSVDGPRRHLAAIPGRLPDLRQVPPGCIFAPRCPAAEAICSAEMPALPGTPHASRCHFRDTLALPPPPPLPEAAAEAEATGRPLLQMVGLEKAFGGALTLPFLRRAPLVRAVDQVTLEVPPGRTLAVVGESGSGKSTLARCVAGLIQPEAGAIRLADTVIAPLVQHRPRAQQRAIGFIFQNPDAAQNPHWTVERIIGRPLELYGALPEGETLRRCVIALLEATKLGERYLSRFPRELSGGEKQRVAIARAFAGAPRLVVCDEPTSALDVSVQAAILEELLALQGRLGTSYLFISHDLGVVRHIAHQVAIMRRGRIVEHGPTAAVFAAPKHEYTRTLLAAVPSLAGVIEAWGGRCPPQTPPAKGRRAS